MTFPAPLRDAGRIYVPLDLVAKVFHEGYHPSNPSHQRTDLVVKQVWLKRIGSTATVSANQLPAGVLSELAMAMRPLGVAVG